MFLIDDLLTAPGKAVFFVFQELARKAQEELLDDESVKRELQEIYNLLSNGKISEAEFEGRENRLIERLEQIAKLKGRSGTGAIADTATLHDSETTDSNDPDPQPVIESKLDVASLTPSASTNFNLTDDVFEALRSLSQLVSPLASPDTTEAVQGSTGSAREVAPMADHAKPPCEPKPAPPVCPVSPSTAKPIPMSDAVDIALRTLAITRLKVSSIISAGRADDGWRVAVELVERAAVPATRDLLGIYEVHLSQTGEVTRYERTCVRRRNDLR
jgi:hypothetical protein